MLQFINWKIMDYIESVPPRVVAEEIRAVKAVKRYQ
jgi:hypothetical protein